MQKLDRYQLAGLDDRERGFSRPIDFEQAGEEYRAILRYEALHVATDLCPTQELALMTLVRTMQTRGYRQLKTQMNYRNGVYLGSQELWIEYPDPAPEIKSTGLLARFTGWLRARMAHD